MVAGWDETGDGVTVYTGARAMGCLFHHPLKKTFHRMLMERNENAEAG